MMGSSSRGGSQAGSPSSSESASQSSGWPLRGFVILIPSALILARIYPSVTAAGFRRCGFACSDDVLFFLVCVFYVVVGVGWIYRDYSNPYSRGEMGTGILIQRVKRTVGWAGVFTALLPLYLLLRSGPAGPWVQFLGFFLSAAAPIFLVLLVSNRLRYPRLYEGVTQLQVLNSTALVGQTLWLILGPVGWLVANVAFHYLFG